MPTTIHTLSITLPDSIPELQYESTVVTQDSGIDVNAVICVAYIDVGVNEGTLLDYLGCNMVNVLQLLTCVHFEGT